MQMDEVRVKFWRIITSLEVVVTRREKFLKSSTFKKMSSSQIQEKLSIYNQQFDALILRLDKLLSSHNLRPAAYDIENMYIVINKLNEASFSKLDFTWPDKADPLFY
jgi:hypothetical protein